MKIPNANNKAFMTVLLVFAVDLTAFAFLDETRLRIPGREHDGLSQQVPTPSTASSESRSESRCVQTAQSHDRSGESSIPSAFSIDDHEYVIWNEVVIIGDRE